MDIIVFGDSIGWGAFDDEKGGWVERLKIYLFKYESIVYNCCISGNTSQNVLERMDAEINSRKVQDEEIGIIIAIGGNDCGFDNSGIKVIPLENYLSNLEQILDRAKKITDKILFVGLTPVDDEKTNPVSWDENLNYSNEFTSQYNFALKEFCKKNNISFCDVIDFPKEQLTDGCHPNKDMHHQIFQRVKNLIVA